MTPVTGLRRVAAGTLSAAAGVLGVTSRVVERGASLLRGQPTPAAPQAEPMPWDEAPRRAARRDEAVDEEPDATASEPAAAPSEPAAAPPPSAPDFDDDAPRVRSPETHAAALAARPAAEVVAAVDGLSTDELRALYEQESRGKRRKTVLTAIERALTPTR